jgi:hypothetical protein
MRKTFYALGIIGCLLVGTASATITPQIDAYAWGDEIGGSSSSGSDSSSSSNSSSSSSNSGSAMTDESSQTMADYLQNYQPVTSEDMEQGQAVVKPFVRYAGTFITAGIVILTICLFLLTVLDLAYIIVPPLRNVLYKGGQGGGSMMPGSMMPGRGMGPSRSGGGGGTQWVSQEAIQAVQASGGGMQGNNLMRGSMGPGNYGGGSAPTGSNALVTYFKSRVVTMVVFGVCCVLLFTNIFFNVGTAIAEFIYNILAFIMQMLNNA